MASFFKRYQQELAIVAGLLYPLLGGSHVTVSGPAAALAPVLLGMLQEAALLVATSADPPAARASAGQAVSLVIGRLLRP